MDIWEAWKKLLKFLREVRCTCVSYFLDENISSSSTVCPLVASCSGARFGEESYVGKQDVAQLMRNN
jgi:hypothetical protein